MQQKPGDEILIQRQIDHTKRQRHIGRRRGQIAVQPSFHLGHHPDRQRDGAPHHAKDTQNQRQCECNGGKPPAKARPAHLAL